MPGRSVLFPVQRTLYTAEWINVKLCGLTGDQKQADALRRQSTDRHGVLRTAQGELVVGTDNGVDADASCERD